MWETTLNVCMYVCQELETVYDELDEQRQYELP